MTPLNVYPSTSDAKPGKDLVLSILKSAKNRYRDNGTDDTYIDDEHGYTCAVGSVFKTAGITGDVLDHTDVYVGLTDGHFRAVKAIVKEPDLREATITAMRLLDAAALELFPEVFENLEDGDEWSGPLETLNQHVEDDFYEVTKPRILKCYKHAIKVRKAEIA